MDSKRTEEREVKDGKISLNLRGRFQMILRLKLERRGNWELP